MIELVVFALIIAVGVLWTRLQSAERKLEAVIDQSRDRFRAIDARLAEGVSAAAPVEAEAEVAEPETAPELDLPEALPPDTSPAPADEGIAEEAAEEVAQPAETIAYVQPDEPPISETPQTQEEPEAEPEPILSRFDFEDIFGRRLPIWAGGIALAIAGIFLVRYAIEAGLFTPVFRVAASFLFGFGLIGLAEFAYRNEEKVADPRVRQALAGAGIATLFGAFYLAGTGYGLIGPSIAFIGLAAVTAGAIALSFRFGLPCAVLGLVGGFAAPVMVQSDSANVPLLALYLGLVTGGLAWTGVKQGQRWLGYLALAIGLGWGLLMQAAGLGGSGDILALGGYLIVLGTVLPAFMYDREGPGAIQLIAGAAATLQMAMIVGQGGFEPLTWALYLLIAAAMAGLGWRFPNLRPGSAIAAFIGFWLLSLWPEASLVEVSAVTGAMVVIFLAVPLVHVWREQAGLIDWGQIAFGAVGIGAALGYQLAIVPDPRMVSDPVLAACLAGLAAFPITAFALLWRRDEMLELNISLILLGAIYLLVFPALLLVSPAWMAPVMASALALCASALLWAREAMALRIAAWASIAMTFLALIATPHFEPEFLRLADEGESEAPLRALVRWAALVPGLIAMALIRAKDASRHIADGLSAIVIYGTLAQVAPGEMLPALAAFGGACILVLRADRFMAWGVTFAIALAWSAWPVTKWLIAGGQALGGFAFFAEQALVPLDILLRLAPVAVLAGLVALRSKDLPREVRIAFVFVPMGFALLSLHSLYKQGFAINSVFQFEQYGMAERSIWQAILLLLGLGLAQIEHARMSPRLRQIAANGFIAASLAHFTWFTLILHNPLYSAQHVGPTPVANWLSLAYGGAILCVIALRPAVMTLWEKGRVACDSVIMGLITLLAVSLLRQIYSGSLLIAVPIGSTESLLLSLLGIALALGFLWWGSVANQRSWRIGSLVLMLIAVIKVFLIDAAGLEGLLRIASFMALGFSLIGIGWVYSRQLRSRPALTQ